MNMHKSGEPAKKKNSLVSTYLDYCDFYRPKIFILENVLPFATDDESAVLRICIKRLLSMGYQCTFDILQVTQSMTSLYINYEIAGRSVWSATESSSAHSVGCKS